MDKSQGPASGEPSHSRPGSPGEFWDDVNAMWIRVDCVTQVQAETAAQVDALAENVVEINHALNQIEAREGIQKEKLEQQIAASTTEHQKIIENLKLEQKKYAADLKWMKEALKKGVAQPFAKLRGQSSKDMLSENLPACLEEGRKSEKVDKGKCLLNVNAESEQVEKCLRKGSSWLAAYGLQPFVLGLVAVVALLFISPWLRSSEVPSKHSSGAVWPSKQNQLSEAILVPQGEETSLGTGRAVTIESSGMISKDHIQVLDVNRQPKHILVNQPISAAKQEVGSKASVLDPVFEDISDEFHATKQKVDHSTHSTEHSQGAEHNAARPHNTAAIDAILHYTGLPNINAKGKDGKGVLDEAIILGDQKLAREILDDKTYTELNSRDKDGRTAIHAVAVAGNAPIAKMIMESERFVELNAKDRHGCSALHHAAAEGHADIVRLLLDNWYFLLSDSTDENGRTALHHAAVAGKQDVVQMLLDHKRFKNADQLDQHNQTALHGAVASGKVEVAKSILQHHKFTSSNVHDKGGWSALSFAAAFDNKEMVATILMSDRFDANSKDTDGKTALHHATFCGDAALVKFILDDDKFTEANHQDAKGSTALHYAAASGFTDVVNVLVKHERFTALNEYDTGGWTAFHYSAISGHFGIIHVFLKSPKADVNMKDNVGMTSLHHAARNGFVNIVLALLGNQRFTEVDAQDQKGKTAMHMAARAGHLEVVQALLEHKRFTAITDDDLGGRNALHFAAEQGHADIVALFLRRNEKGLQMLESQDYNGQTPQEMADERDHKKVLDVIKRYAPVTTSLPSLASTQEQSDEDLSAEPLGGPKEDREDTTESAESETDVTSAEDTRPEALADP